MTSRNKITLAIVAAAMAVGLSLGTDAGANANLDWDHAGIKGIQTDQTGAITAVEYMDNNVNKTVNGCGAKLEALPHLMEAFRMGKAVDLGIDGNCLKMVTFRK